MKVALLISTYNWPAALRAVLRSLAEQTRMPDEVLIADDGSREETEMVIEKSRKVFEIPVKHVWQEDKGFRKSEVLNKALAKTEADYIVQIDGDCIMHKEFMKDHLSQVENGSFLYGSRVNIKPEAVDKVLAMNRPAFSFFSDAIKNKTRNLRIPAFQDFYKPSSEFSGKTRGCNLSYWRNDLISVNGYDESIQGWGREDSEMVLRMLNSGVKGKRLRYGGIVYHIYHPEKSREHLAVNNQIQEETVQGKKSWCKNGIDQYLVQS